MMRAVFAFALGALALCGTASAQEPGDAFAAVRAGAVECFTPDVASKSCRAIATYQFAPNGAVTYNAAILLQPQPLMVMLIHSTAYARDGMICGPLQASDYETAQFLIDGQPPNDETIAALRAQIGAAIAPMEGEACSRYVLHGARYIVEGYVNGQRMPDDTMIHVQPTDGYVVRPVPSP